MTLWTNILNKFLGGASGLQAHAQGDSLGKWTPNAQGPSTRPCLAMLIPSMFLLRLTNGSAGLLRTFSKWAVPLDVHWQLMGPLLPLSFLQPERWPPHVTLLSPSSNEGQEIPIGDGLFTSSALRMLPKFSGTPQILPDLMPCRALHSPTLGTHCPFLHWAQESPGTGSLLLLTQPCFPGKEAQGRRSFWMGGGFFCLAPGVLPLGPARGQLLPDSWLSYICDLRQVTNSSEPPFPYLGAAAAAGIVVAQ